MCPGPVPRKSCLKKDGGTNTIGAGSNIKKVFFDEVMIKEYPNVLGDHPAVYVVGASTQLEIQNCGDCLILTSCSVRLH